MTSIHIYTDASYNPIEGVAGYAYIIYTSKTVIKKSGVIKGDTKNAKCAELVCIINAIYGALLLNKIPLHVKTINIYSDCLYAIKDIYKEEKSDLANEARVALDKLKEKVRSVTKSRIRVKMIHVKAHTGGNDIESKCNEWCDVEARKAMRSSIVKNKA